MIVIDDKTFKIDNIIISPSKCKINKKEVETNKIEIISKECETSFIIYTLVPFSDFNTFPLNEKISIIHMIIKLINIFLFVRYITFIMLPPLFN